MIRKLFSIFALLGLLLTACGTATRTPISTVAPTASETQISTVAPSATTTEKPTFTLVPPTATRTRIPTFTSSPTTPPTVTETPAGSVARGFDQKVEMWEYTALDIAHTVLCVDNTVYVIQNGQTVLFNEKISGRYYVTYERPNITGVKIVFPNAKTFAWVGPNPASGFSNIWPANWWVKLTTTLLTSYPFSMTSVTVVTDTVVTTKWNEFVWLQVKCSIQKRTFAEQYMIPPSTILSLVNNKACGDGEFISGWGKREIYVGTNPLPDELLTFWYAKWNNVGIFEQGAKNNKTYYYSKDDLWNWQAWYKP